jgi:predicted Zn-dependent protease
VLHLESPDAHHLNAALGWLGLNLPAEALQELEQLSASAQNHPDVLELRWETLARQLRWSEARQVATQLIAQAPDRASGWLHRAYAVRRTPDGGLDQAWEALEPAATKFPKEPVIAYNLSCYACQLEQLDAARGWLRRAFSLGDPKEIKRMALADADLQPLWSEIEKF